MLNFIKSLSRSQKRNIMLFIDAMLVPIALFFSFSLHANGEALVMMLAYLPVLPYLLIIGGALSVLMGISTIQLNAYETGAIGLTGAFSVALVIVSYLLTTAARIPITIPTHIVFGISFFIFSIISRAVLLQIVLAIYRRSSLRCRVLIYGAGTTGTQLVSALRSHEHIEPVAFVDDSKALHGLIVARLPVYSPVRIAEIAAEKRIDRVLLALPSLSLPKQAQISRRLQKMGLEVQALPSFAQLVGEEALVDKLTDVEPKLFLNRDEVATETGASAIASYQGKTVLISGAGGSIGSELCRQVMQCSPAKMVLFELSEVALYKVDMELRQIAEDTDIEIVPVLGTVTDARQVRGVLSDHNVQVVLHAAAYKHVPLVETNPLTGLANNVLGTHTLATEAAKTNVERFILISSDKAVRPTNVMGASKRLAELVVQDLASRVSAGDAPIYTMVRFGNVLGSSGSVVPLFQEQLRRGGPVTVTHPEVSRYFMTAQEAVHLVLRAGAMAKGGEVFVLDMGKPVHIEKLARQVIESAGYTVRDAKNPDGDIEIEFIGLRPGEKMTEELTLTGNLIGTTHRKIFSADEMALSEIEIASALRALRAALASNDEQAAREVALRWVEGYSNSRHEQLADATQFTPV
ncbi:NDP-sugar epimerase, includes UDP-GlcNAc-inverting 4,6-dehydratase FlaA1 and capsular polysaccharide biosynthesis protein EpsC [Pseudosulfitobacter pseudonitzschiae]|uniref:Nucleotide sugar epimerase n=1 Tax=Pseudosulfitobacter pseudonitzschiae TaxID=1402135 RepID=A0A073JGQ9_9RHOB|nr:nucleoside-diphosphate sugar epimerase/dehydratase [Pseudosulfitobacter pseudonitzschiae]KEJ96912.1 nucleotide sugar epimerase [Pseudosulfitobacter pseudonitzschiae]SHF46399.1 NDP-sugar epimerase, includes UDP-GlcNAc-inverting 4,6-dehydratase FlaA1 and capsular polysaccharide biosynthesis protein EpsC [Pseudosulfitobacter pseudonitzschiae]